MKIDGNKPSSPVGKKKTPPKQTGGDQGNLFSALLGGSEAPTHTEQAAPLHSPTSLLSLQEDTSDQDARKRSIKHGDDILDELDKLHQSLLTGSITEPQLQRLQQLAQHSPTAKQNPELAETLREISIRAAVELAKLGK